MGADAPITKTEDTVSNEQGKWVDVGYADIRTGDRVKARDYDEITVAKITRCGPHTDIIDLRGGLWWADCALFHWQRWEPIAAPSPPPPIPPRWPDRPVEYVPAGTACELRKGDFYYPRYNSGWSGAVSMRESRPTVDTWIQRATPVTAEPPKPAPPADPHAGDWSAEYVALENEVKSYMAHNPALIPPELRPDPHAELRAEAKRMLAEGHDPRDVLGALDECLLGRLRCDLRSAAVLLHRYRITAISDHSALHARCYHGNLARSCGWCATYPPPAAVEHVECAWESPGEES